MLTRQRLDAPAPAAREVTTRVTRRRSATKAALAARARALVHLPEEIWLLVCGFLRSADFPPC